MAKIDRSTIAKAAKVAQLTQSLVSDRLYLLIAFFASVVTAGLLIYMTLDKDRLEIVYRGPEKIDVPTLLEKVRDNTDAIKTDRWVRGFVRRVIGYYFISPDDSADFALKAVGWLHAHSGESGQKRSASFMADMSKFESLRKEKYALFYPLNDPSSLKIRLSDETSGVFYVEVPGTYNTHADGGEAFYDAKLKIVIEKVPVSGFPSEYGVINAVGLSLVNGTIEFNEDITKENEITRVQLFRQAD